MSWLRTEVEKVFREVSIDCFIIGEVKKVNGNTVNVAPLNGDPMLFNVRLNLTEKTEGFSLMPKAGSIVLVGCIDGDEKNNFVAMYSEVDSMKFNGDQFGGLIKIEQLIERMNKIEQKHDALCTQLELLPVPVSGAVSGPPVPGSYSGVKIGDLTLRNALENTLIKHG